MPNVLNVRHRINATHDSVSPMRENAVGNRDKQRRVKRAGTDTHLATSAVLCFLIVGFSGAYFLLHHRHRRVIMHAVRGNWGRRHGAQNVLGHVSEKQTRLFVTVVMPSVVNPKGRLQRLHAITDTWGPQSRALYVVHNISEYPELSNDVVSLESLGSLSHSSYPKILLVPQSISPDDGVPRLNYVIRTVHEKIRPSFALFVNDHTFVIPDHLDTFLAEKSPEKPLYAGHALKQDRTYFNSGAAGYVLSKQSMKGLVEKWDAENEICLARNAKPWLQGNPGLVTAQCLINVLKTPSIDSRENMKWHRFHAFGLVRSISGNVDQWYINKHQDMDEILGTDASYNKLLNGTDCCSKETVSFHYVEHLETRALYKIRQALLRNCAISDSDLEALIIRQWPKSRKELGYYSQVLPPEKSLDEWSALMRVLRKISSTPNKC